MNIKFVEEAESFLEQHPNIRDFDLLLPDMNAVFRGKRIQREKLISIYKKGFYFPASVFAMDVTGETMEETGLGFKSGDQDIPCYPIPETLKVVPWRKERGQLLLRMLEPERFSIFLEIHVKCLILFAKNCQNLAGKQWLQLKLSFI